MSSGGEYEIPISGTTIGATTTIFIFHGGFKMSVMEGPLSKWTNVMKGWQYRWFVLDDNAGLLSYYTSKEKMVRGARRGCVRLKGAVVGIDDEDDSTFTVTVDGKIFHFQARDAEERERWVRALEDTILRHTHNRINKRWDAISPLASIQDFDRKLTESDAYLQLLIDQVKDLEERCEKITDERERNQVIAVKEKANAMVESIKHSIVLLQIAKNTTYPLNGVFQPPKDNNDYNSNKQSPLKEMNSGSAPSLISQSNSQGVGSKSQLLIDEAIDAGKEMVTPASEDPAAALTAISTSSSLSSLQSACSSAVANQPATGISRVESGMPALLKTSTSAHLNLVVPETSYSSSDDDDFYDATDDAVMSVQSPVMQRDTEKNEGGSEQIEPAIKMNKKFDLDALYEEDEEDDLGSLEGHGSVISHLLSQVKIGMDLTKVVLPTFILERRSLLEMYADFFAHPDLFVSIPDFPDPKDRMVQVVKWYLSAFHAGRKSSVAKKPYNPILGEVFKCCWDVPGLEPCHEKVENGPVPWADKQNLTFIAEQVSHHPPISAFYAEHYNKGITCCAHIWTKSKFLGLSIGVQNIGQGCISLLKYDEEYIINFPSGYGRSILTVPWIELGGQVQITCAKTGYHANIEFLTKPFYGGKKHRITADVFQPQEKKPFVTVTGEWNGVMHAKWASGKTELFVDTQAISIIRKNVKKIVDQEPFESRRLWKDVTAALKVRNVEAATKAKFVLEQRQRDEARERREKNLKWENRVFHETGELWIYDTPLHKRLATAKQPPPNES